MIIRENGKSAGRPFLRTHSRDIGVIQPRYLVDLDGGREDEAMLRLLQLPHLGPEFFGHLGLHPPMCWYILRANIRALVHNLEGDVDILAGELEWLDHRAFDAALSDMTERYPEAHPSHQWLFAAWQHAADGGLRWPLRLDNLVAVEGKCARATSLMDIAGRRMLKSTKDSASKRRAIQGQIQKLVGMGFDRVVLLDVIANPPGRGAGIGAWLEGAKISDQSQRAMEAALHRRLPASSSAGHWVWSAGAAVGGDELEQGAGVPVELRPAGRPTMTAATKAWRLELDANLSERLRDFPTL